jgi:pantoate--beta-alanine ligase
MAQLLYSLTDWQQLRRMKICSDKTLGLVPTMGNLHQGHASLLARSVKENDFTVLTIFVNPTQFNDANDLANYPRTVEDDVKLARNTGVDFILIPSYQDLYPDNYQYKVVEKEFSQELCGKFRPGHFDGMLTVVLKLLILAQATRAYFGEKDFQQLQLITGMTKAFFINTTIIPCATVRDQNGLALSSRNKLLQPEHHAIAALFPKILSEQEPLEIIKNKLSEQGFIVEYIEEHQNRRFGAVRLGNVRLIDNIIITPIDTHVDTN